MQSSSDLVFVVDPTAAVTYASPSCTEVLGYEPELLLGSETGAWSTKTTSSDLRDTLAPQRSRLPGDTAEFCFRVRHGDGSWRWLEGIATNLFDDPAVQGVVINARDVTERRARLEQQAAIAELGRDVLRETSLEAVVESATSVIERMVRRPRLPDRRASSTCDDAGDRPRRCAGRRPVRPPSMASDASGPGRRSGTAAGPHRGCTRTIRRRARTSSSSRGSPGILLSAIVRTRAEDAIRHQATHDPLTGSAEPDAVQRPPRARADRRSRVGGYVAVMVVDLDGFKNVNDSLGHLTGDALLIAVADRFDAHLRDFDTIARLGGDEFAILVDDLDAPDQAGRVAQRVLDALVEPVAAPRPHRRDRREHRDRARRPRRHQGRPAPQPCRRRHVPRRNAKARAATACSRRRCTPPRSSA